MNERPDSPDEELHPWEWALLIPTAALAMVNGVLGFVLFVLFVGIVVYRQHPDAWPLRLPGRKQRRLPAASTDDALLEQLLATPNPPPSPAPPPTSCVPLPTRSWMKQALAVHHLLVIGETGSGKTTAVRALLPYLTGMLVIIDPKDHPGKWDMSAVGLDADLEYSRIEQTCQVLLRELKQRQHRLQQGTDVGEPLTIVCDEFPDVVSECPTAASMFKKVGRIGRELRVRLTALSQSASVKTLGISGEGDVRENYTWLYLGKRAVRVMPELNGSPFPGVLDIGGEARAIETHHLPTLARLPLTRARPWEPVQVSPMGQTADDYTVTGQDWSDRSDWSDQGDTENDATGQTGISDTQIRKWLAAGIAKNEIARRLGGSKGKAYERINAAMAISPDEDDEPPAAFEFLG